MSRIALIPLLLVFGVQKVFAQTTIYTSAIKTELHAIFERDQKTRTGKDSTAFMNYIDSSNLIQMESLLTKYGWMGKSFIGAKGNNTLFLVIQHASLATQEKYLSMMQK